MDSLADRGAVPRSSTKCNVIRLPIFDPPADLKSFVLGPSLFKEYAVWKKRVRADVVKRKLVTTQQGSSLLVWFRKRPPKKVLKFPS